MAANNMMKKFGTLTALATVVLAAPVANTIPTGEISVDASEGLDVLPTFQPPRVDGGFPDVSEIATDSAFCTVRSPGEFAYEFANGPNACAVDQVSSPMLFSRVYFNVDGFNNPLPATNPTSRFSPAAAKPFVFASGDGGCVNEFLQAGVGHTSAQWDTILDIGYSTDSRCSYVRTASNSKLLVWRAYPQDNPVWATWENVVPYMAQLYGISTPAVTADLFKATPYATFAGNPQYQTEMQAAAGPANDCAVAYAPNSAYMQAALMDPSGIKFRAALERCFSFFDIFTGNGYTLNMATGQASKCREFLVPNRAFGELAQDSITVVDLQLGVNYQVDEQC